MKYVATPVAVSVHLAGDCPITGDSAKRVSIDDVGAGPFVVVLELNSSDPLLPGTGHFDMEALELVARVARDLYEQQPNKGAA